MEPNANTNVSRHNSGPASPVGKRSRHAALTGHVGFAASAAAPSQQVRDVTTQQWCTPLAGRGGVRVRRCDRRQNILTGAQSIFFPASTFCSVVVVGQTDRRGILRSPSHGNCTTYGLTIATEERRRGPLFMCDSAPLAYVLPMCCLM
eukprot:scaffold118624_cov57-Phaeocystis_antarctica.AAC.2